MEIRVHPRQFGKRAAMETAMNDKKFFHDLKEVKEMTFEDSPARKAMLGFLNTTGKHIYAGTVSPKEVERRRAKNKVARISRRKNRG